MAKSNSSRSNKGGRSSSPSSQQQQAMKKSPVAMERLMTKSSKKYKRGGHNNNYYYNLNNYKGSLAKIVMGVMAFFLASGVMSFLSKNTSINVIHNLANDVLGMGLGMGALRMDMAGSSSFSVPMAQPSYKNAPQGQNGSGNGNSGRIFAQAHNQNQDSDIHRKGNGNVDNANINGSGNNGHGNNSNDIISLGSDFTVDNNDSFSSSAASTLPKYNNGYDKYADEMSMYNYNYYYYDSSTQAFHLHEQFATFLDKPVVEVSTSTIPFQRALSLSGRYQPSLCSDGITHGFSDLATLRNAIHELNDAYSHAVYRWEHYNNALSEYEVIKFLHQQQSSSSGQPGSGGGEAEMGMDMDMVFEIEIESPPPLPDHLTMILEVEPDPFVICPHATLRAPLGRHMTLNINAEDVVVECDSCVIDTPGTHFSFGPHAKNVLIKGITMMGATESSIVFRFDGADASFEDCYWVNNESVGMHGAVADMNSTSVVKFYRCEISDVKQSSPRAGMHGAANTVTSSLTLRR